MKNLLLVLFLVVSPAVYSQSSDPILAPPRKDLVPLYWPNLANLEPSVREQITELQNALAATAKNPAISTTDLSEAYGKLGQIYHVYSLMPPARDCYSNANVLAPKDFRWIYLTAEVDRQQGRIEDAIRRYRLAGTLKPDYIAVPVNLGNIFLGLNRLEEAGESFKAALELDKNSPAAHYGLGQIALSVRNYPEAIQHFNQTLAQVPSANRVHYSLAMAYRGLGDVEKVKAHLAQQGSVGVRVSDPLVDGLQELIEGERVHLARGKLAFEARQYAEAAVEFRKAVAENPGNVAARINLGATLSQLGDVTGAAEQFEEAIRIEPQRVNAHYNLAILLAGQNKHEQAIIHLQSALKVAPSDAEVRSLLDQELAKAERLAHYLATAPELKLRNGTRALELAQRVYNTTSSPQHGALVALALAELGRCPEASDWLRRMIVIAEQQNKSPLATKLQLLLKLSERSQTCRPPTDPTLTNLPNQ